jgi:hypothetical protein
MGLKTSTPDLSKIAPILPKQKNVFEEYIKIDEPKMEKPLLQYADKVQSVANSMADMWSQALINQWDSGQSFFTNMARGFEQMLASMAASLAAKAAIFGIFSLFGGGALLGGFNNFMGFQHGASFIVPGTGGVDNQLAAFRVSPGERITVTPSNVYNINIRGSVDSIVYKNNLLPTLRKLNRGLAI